MENKAIKLSSPVERYIRSINAGDSDALLAVFSQDAVVNDIGREVRGINAIKDLANREIFSVNVALNVKSAVQRGDRIIVTFEIDGTFDRTGLPDPLLMDHTFAVASDKIEKLNCQLAGEYSET